MKELETHHQDNLQKIKSANLKLVSLKKKYSLANGFFAHFEKKRLQHNIELLETEKQGYIEALIKQGIIENDDPRIFQGQNDNLTKYNAVITKAVLIHYLNSQEIKNLSECSITLYSHCTTRRKHDKAIFEIFALIANLKSRIEEFDKRLRRFSV